MARAGLEPKTFDSGCSRQLASPPAAAPRAYWIEEYSSLGQLKQELQKELREQDHTTVAKLTQLKFQQHRNI